MKKTRILAILLMLAASLSMLGAEGLKEQGADETLVKVVSIDKGDDGAWRISALREDGTEVIYIYGDESTSTYPLENIAADDYLMIRDNGISTMSIPPQMQAIAVRYVTPAVINGLIAADFYTPVQHPGLILDITEIDDEDLLSRFSFAYGYISMLGLNRSSLYPHAGYFARGVIDAGDTDEVEPMLTVDEMNEALTEYIAEYIEKGLVTDYGELCTTMDQLLELGTPETLPDRFAYSYGYFSFLNLIYSGLEVYPEEFAYGALTASYGSTMPYTLEEMNGFIEEYIAELQAEYQAWIEEMSADNLAAAESFLADNAAREGIITLDSGLQLEYTYDDKSDSARPAKDSIVVVDYTLTLMDGTVMDQGEDVEFSLQNLIPGFSEAVMQMNVGDSVRAYVHPSLGYGENGTPTIQPNSLLIFDITLDSIK